MRIADQLSVFESLPLGPLHHRQYLVDGVEVPIVVPALELADVPGQVLRRHPVVDARVVQNKVEAPMRGRTCSSGDGG